MLLFCCTPNCLSEDSLESFLSRSVVWFFICFFFLYLRGTSKGQQDGVAGPSQDNEQPGPSRRKRQPSMSESMPLYTLCKEDLDSMDKEVRKGGTITTTFFKALIDKQLHRVLTKVCSHVLYSNIFIRSVLWIFVR